MKPIEQIQIFFSWFNRQHTDLFDIHIRKSVKADQDYKTGQRIWITDYENIGWRYIETKLLSWLRRENAAGSDIFFRPTRTKET
jgi:hypothetical protein